MQNIIAKIIVIMIMIIVIILSKIGVTKPFLVKCARANLGQRQLFELIYSMNTYKIKSERFQNLEIYFFKTEWKTHWHEIRVI